MNRFSQVADYLNYYFTSVNRHSVHSPFIYTLVDKVINNRKKEVAFKVIEKQRKRLKNDQQLIDVIDFGAGTKGEKITKRTIASIAKTSAKPVKYASLLYRITCHYKPKIMVELGTSFGISALYQAAGNPDGKLYTLEGNPSSADIAASAIANTGNTNIQIIKGKFQDTLPQLLKELPSIDYAFIDGHHQKLPTLEYFNLLLRKSHKETVFIFDDINWSSEMKEAWTELKNHPSVRVTVDLFMMGIVYINPELSKQDYIIRY